MVPATAVPKTKAAIKFQKAAQATARNGVRTRVETTVAMELAASCEREKDDGDQEREARHGESGAWFVARGE
jgi:hypothetical protein